MSRIPLYNIAQSKASAFTSSKALTNSKQQALHKDIELLWYCIFSSQHHTVHRSCTVQMLLKKGAQDCFCAVQKWSPAFSVEGHLCYGDPICQSCWLKCTPQKAFLIHCSMRKLIWELKACWPWQFTVALPQHLHSARWESISNLVIE